jgi:hypothetical protein
VPAAAVIPAPIAYAKVVAVKKLVVEPRAVGGGCGSWVSSVLSGNTGAHPSGSSFCTALLCCGVAVPLTGCWR